MDNKRVWQAWFIWGVAGLYVLYQFILQASTSVMIPSLKDSLNINITQVGILSYSFFYTYVALQIPAGIIVDRLGARRLLIISMGLCALASFSFGFAQHLYVAELSRLLMGMATAPAVVAALYLAANWLPSERFSLAAGLTEMLGMIGGAVGETFLAQFVTHLGWRGAMYSCSVIAIILMILTWCVVRDSPKPTPRHDLTATPESEEQHYSIMAALIYILEQPQSWFNGIYAGLMFAIIQVFASLWAVPFFNSLYGYSLTWVAALSSMLFLGTAAGTPLVGWIAGYLRRRKLVMFWGAVGSLLTLMIIIYLPGVPFFLMFILLFLLGMFCAAYILPFSLMKEIMPLKVRGTALAYTNTMIVLGAPLLNPLIGSLLAAMSDSKGQLHAHAYPIANYQWAFSILPIGLALALFMLIFIKEQ
jgi:MFS family permease